jgi:dUTP pyrophosphatase
MPKKKRLVTYVTDVGGQPPTRHYQDDAGYDLTVSRTVTIPPGGFAQVPHAIKVALPEGTWGLVLGRSSTFYRRCLIVNPGVIDVGWRGELLASVYNPSQTRHAQVKKGDRIAQLIVISVVPSDVAGAAQLEPGSRGERGFGSTGGWEAG